MLSAIISKLVSEAMLSLHPIMIKYIKMDMLSKLWNRIIWYFFISIMFINWDFILNNLFTYNAFLLSFVLFFHIYFTHRGFLLLDSGVGYTLYYTYPIMIILMSGININSKIMGLLVLIIIGIILLYEPKDVEKQKNKPNINEIVEENYKYEGIISVLLCAFTEALIFFIVRRIKTNNHWNHLFLSYFYGAIIITIYMLYMITKGKLGNNSDNSSNTIEINQKYKDNFIKLSFFNIIIGTVGYYLKYFAIYNLSPLIYSILSYVGIITAFIYGVVINKDKIDVRKTVGAIIIIIANVLLLKM